MLREQGFVVGLDGDHALVSSYRQSACGSCHAQASCSTLSAGLGNRENRIRALNPIGAEVGEQVVLEISEKGFLRASFLVYGLPIAALVGIGSLARALLLAMGVAAQTAEGGGAIAGLLALVASFFWLHRQNSRLEKDPDTQPVIASLAWSAPPAEKGGDACPPAGLSALK